MIPAIRGATVGGAPVTIRVLHWFGEDLTKVGVRMIDVTSDGEDLTASIVVTDEARAALVRALYRPWDLASLSTPEVVR